MPSSGGQRKHPRARWQIDEEKRLAEKSQGKPADDGLQDGEAIVTTTIYPSRSSSAHPLGSGCIDGDLDHHDWQPVSFRFETQLLDEEGRVLVRQPDIEKARVYFICMKCRGYTYGVFNWVGFYLGDTDDVLPESLRAERG